MGWVVMEIPNEADSTHMDLRASTRGARGPWSRTAQRAASTKVAVRVPHVCPESWEPGVGIKSYANAVLALDALRLAIARWLDQHPGQHCPLVLVDERRPTVLAAWVHHQRAGVLAGPLVAKHTEPRCGALLPAPRRQPFGRTWGKGRVRRCTKHRPCARHPAAHPLP